MSLVQKIQKCVIGNAPIVTVGIIYFYIKDKKYLKF